MTHDSISYLKTLCSSILLLRSGIESAQNAAAHHSELKKQKAKHSSMNSALRNILVSLAVG